MKPSLLHVLSLLAACLASWGSARAQGLLITEFMAINERTIADEDGDYTDWIEIFNPGQSAVNLEGYHLTDRQDHLLKWRFPAVGVPAGGYLLVFASEKHRGDPSSELHTNFKLTGEREFLGLSDPLGALVHSYSPTFPIQFPAISYGLSQPSAEMTLVAERAPGSVLVPTGGGLGTSWTAAGFNDATWTRGPGGIGYDTGPDYGALIGTDIEGAMRTRNASAYLRFPFDLADPSGIDSLTLRIKYDDGFVAYLNGQEVARRNAPAAPQWNSAATADHGQPVTGSMGQDFDGGGTPYVLTAHAGPPPPAPPAPPAVVAGGPGGSFLRLMPDSTGDLTNTVGFDRTSGPSDVLIADFDYRMPVEAGHTGCCGERADGFGFALLATIEYGATGPAPSVAGVAWERPALPDAFAVGFDIFDGTGAENTVTLNWNGVEVGAARVGTFPLNNGVFNRVHLEARKDGADSVVNLTLTPDSLGNPGAAVPVFVDFRVPGMNPFDGRVAFGGRTGGAFTALDLDNIDVVFAPSSPVIAYEDLDLTAWRGALLLGANVLAFHGLNRASGDADFLIAPLLEAMDFGGVEIGGEYFPTPTPGHPNLPGVAGVAGEPLFSRPSGAYPANFTVSLSTASPGTAIRYTTNGLEPTAASSLYSTPIAINRTTVLKARGFKTGLLPSRAADRVYVRLDSATTGFESNLPILIFDTFGQGIGQSGFTLASGIIVDAVDGLSTTTATPDWSGSGGLKQRGSSSTGFPKKQFAFEVWDGSRQDRDAAILGFPAEADYIIYGPYTDKTLMRDVLSYKWSDDIGRYAVRSRFVEVFLKTAAGATLNMSDYVGVYAFMEKIKRDRNRVDIRNLRASEDTQPGISGGYILKKDRLDPGDVGFQTGRGQTLAFVDPKEQEVTPAQRAYIKGYLDAFEAALYGPNFRDPLNGYAKYIDVDSFIDHHIMVEMTKNIDGFRLSTFMFKDRGGKLNMGPIWDYNLCLGNANYLEGWKPDGWYHPQLGDGDYPWWRRLFQDPDFAQRYIDRWTGFRRSQFLTENLVASVDMAADLLMEAQVRNYQRWPILGTFVWPNQFIGTTYQEEVDWMRAWLEARLEWFDGNYLAPPRFNQDGGVIPPGFTLTMNAPAGTVHYTLDGSDPRLPGGGVSPSARQYGTSALTTLVSSTATPNVRALVPGSDIGLGWTQVGFNDAAWLRGSSGVGVGYETQSGYETLINLDVRAQMHNVNPSIYIRIPFTVANPASYDSLTLKMKYDDGFTAYLNGTAVGSRNGPTPAVWNSPAPVARDETQAVLFENLNITNHLGSLRAGTNVLAIHGLNAGAGSSDLLMLPELVASTSSAGDPVVLGGPTRIIARSELGGAWSGPSDRSFVLDMPLPLRITELMYHPQDPPAGSIHDADDFEFIEILNVGPGPASLLGARFTAGVQFDFSSGRITTLGQGEHLLVVRNLAAFSSRYDTAGLRIAGEYSGNLENAGESVILLDGRGEVILAFDYDDLWYPVTDGSGYSLNIVDPRGDPAAWSDRASWSPSSLSDGSPGAADSGAPPGGFQLPGDGNQDSAVDISDAVALLLHLFLGSSRAAPCEGAAGEGGNLSLLDFNGDARLNVTDPVHALNFLFRQGPPHALGTTCARIAGCPEVCAR